jgi:hypothetical protein
MDLNDAERYAVAALFTLALHSTHVSAFSCRAVQQHQAHPWCQDHAPADASSMPDELYSTQAVVCSCSSSAVMQLQQTLLTCMLPS